MKCVCDKCGRNISIFVDRRYEQREIGRVHCPDCGKKQARYLTRYDLSLYLIISNLIYVLVCYFSIFLIDTYKRKWWVIILLLSIYALTYLFLKNIDRLFYLNPPFKKAWMNKEIYDDNVQVKISLRYQFMLYFGLILMMATSNYDRYVFLILAFALSIILFIKSLTILKKEKAANKL